jgi:hypothetical protein
MGACNPANRFVEHCRFLSRCLLSAGFTERFGHQAAGAAPGCGDSGSTQGRIERERDPVMFASLPDFMLEWWFLGLMIVLLLALIGLLMFLRNKRSDEE